MALIPVRRLRQLSLMLGVCLMTAGGWVSAEIYQWTDEDGQTVFSETPPVDTKSKIVTPKFGKESPAAIEKLRVQSAPAKEPKTGADELADEGEEPTPAQQKENCTKALAVLTQLETTNRLRAKDAEGNIVYLPEEERAGRIDAAQKSIKSWCE